MKTDAQPDIRRYLAAVGREASGLPADQRHELIADLSDHIQSALAERPGALAEILAELGAPHDIAATALLENGAGLQADRRRRDPRTPVVLWATAVVIGLAVGLAHLPRPVSSLPGVLLVAALVTLVRNPCWTTGQKWTAVAASLVAPGLAVSLLGHHGGPVVTATGNILVVALRLSGPLWLWKRRDMSALTMPSGPRYRLSTGARVFLGAVVLIAVLLVAFGAITYFGVSSNITSTGM